jgi:hypothetical protein
VLTKYLEVELLSDVEKLEDHSFKATDIKVIREIPLSELKQNSTVVQYWKEWDRPEKKTEMMEYIKNESEKMSVNRISRMRKQKWLLYLINCIPLIFIVRVIIIIITLTLKW